MLKNKNHCTGCGACSNICSQNAIQIKADEQGFLYPAIDQEKCINCHLCEIVCQNIDSITKNFPLKILALQSKNYKLLQKSSSGGMFAQIAKFILSKNGIVFGCTMEKVTEGFDVKHIYINDEKDLYKLQGSKYVQSNIKNTYKEAKQFLDQNRLVLFSGTPCQIAGLKAFLNNKEYNNLLTVDLSCEGTPSLQLFNDYIKFLENKFNIKIEDFKFRNKKHFGWSTEGFVAIYRQNNKLKEKILLQNLSSYFHCFLNGCTLQEHCYNCKYANLERISDITIADAWGIEQEYPELLKNKFDKNKGISLVLINSNKGLSSFNKIKENIIFEEVNINKLRKYNHPLRQPSIKNELRERYLEVYKNNGYEGLEKLFRQNLGKKLYYYILRNHTPKFIKNILKLFTNKHKKVDCLLMTLFCLSNYGSIITAFALQKTINNLGYSTKLIYYGNIYGYGKFFIKEYLSLTKKCINMNDFKNLNKITNTFVLGSDNLINLETNKLEFIAQNLFNYTEENKKRIMISGSMGSWDGTTKNQEEHNYIKYLFNRFDYLSTREEHGKNVLKNVFNFEADWINDPVFYLTKKDYLDLIKNVTENYNNKIMQYILYPTENTNQIVEYIKQKTGKNIVKFDGNENVKYFSRYKGKKVENWLSAIINSDLIITDSFHCVAFSLIFNRPFVCIKNTHATVRFTSLFKRLGIQIQMVENIEELKNISLTYDIEQVNTKLNDIRNFAISKLKENLIKSKKKNEIDCKMKKYNFDFVKKTIPWYKKNKNFYCFIIVPFIIPFIKLIRTFNRKKY